MKTKEEYENFKEFYYFDYNIINSIISFWENMDNSTFQTSFLLYQILIEFYDLSKICIPYSMAHIWDTIKGTKKYEDKVNIINQISRRWYVSEEKSSDKIRVDKCENILDHFNVIFQSMKMTDDIRNMFNPIIESAFEYSLLNDEFSKNVDSDFYKKIIDMYRKNKVKSIYDMFQFIYKIINIMNIKNNINLRNIPKEVLSEKIEIYMQDNELLNSINIRTINEFKYFCNKNFNNFQQSEFSKEIFIYSFLCDFIGLTKEKKDKVSKDTFVSGMLNDLIHLSIGLRCSVFVTNDKNLRIKAIICKILLGLNVKIFNNENFYHYLINEYAKVKFPEKDKNSFTITVKINNKNYQKTIETNYSCIHFQ
jgi:hypothetical protein